MSVSSEVQRTLVKSPPELWAELSDPTTLARHLGELGEIRIVRTEPERTVDWEAAGANGAEVNGRVEIEPSGWGTRVTLSASRAIVEPEPELTPEPEPVATVAVEEPMPAEPATAQEEIEPPREEIEAAVAPEAEIVDPTPRPGLFARLFRRRRAPEPAAEPKPAVEPEPEPEPTAAVEIEAPALALAPASAETVPEEPTPKDRDMAAELAQLEEVTTAVLTGVLDRLGAAHHRPFSRS